MDDVHQDAMLHRSLVLPVDLRMMKTSRHPFWSDTVRLESRYLIKLVLFSMWHNHEVRHVKTGALKTRFLPLPYWWYHFEVATSFWAQMGPPLSYIGSWIRGSPSYGWWVVVVTKFAVNVTVMFV